MTSTFFDRVRPVAPLLARTAVILVAGTLLGYAGNAIRPDGVALGSFEAPASCDGGEHAPMPEAECEPEVLESLPPESPSQTPGCTDCSVAP